MILMKDNTKILKATVMSADWYRTKNQNARIDDQNARIESENLFITAKNAWINFVKEQRETGKMTSITSEAVVSVLNDFRENQVIGTRDIQKILNCQETKALRIINEMKKKNIITAIPGQGKGRYILNMEYWR